MCVCVCVCVFFTSIFIFLSDLFHFVWQTQGPSTSLRLTQFHFFIRWPTTYWLQNLFLYNFMQINYKHMNKKCFSYGIIIEKNRCAEIQVLWQWKSFSCVQHFVTSWTIQSWNSPGPNTGVGSCSILQEIFQTQGSNPGLKHCRQILYQLSHQGSPSILEWVAYPFSSRSSRHRNWTGVSIAGGFITSWATRVLWGHLQDIMKIKAK